MSLAGQLAILLAIAGQAPAASEPPRGVNGWILGRAEDFQVVGPGRICLYVTSVDLRPGETAQLAYSGIHYAAIRVLGPQGSFQVREGSWMEPRHLRLREDWRGRTIGSIRQDGRPRYLLYGPSAEDDSEYPAVWIEGDALGRSHDGEILDRVAVHSDRPTGCGRQFNYGWDVIFGQLPLEQPQR